MPRFTTAPVDDVAPKRKQPSASPRSQIQAQYRDALRSALVDNHEALVVEFEDGDKPLTIRNRINRAAQALELTDVTVRRRGNRIVAYQRDGVGEE